MLALSIVMMSMFFFILVSMFVVYYIEVGR